MREKNILMAAFPKNETGISNKKKQIVIRSEKTKRRKWMTEIIY